MNRSLWAFGACVLAVACGALAFRLPRLGLRPMHGDEANQALKAGLELHENGVYRYDPHDHHGPSLYYVTLAALRLSGARTYAESGEGDYRIVPVAFGVGLVLLLLGAGDGLGRAAAVAAGVLTAVSPAMVFYSRYYVQEMMLVFFTFATILAAWRYARTGAAAWALLAGACIGLMHATKETWVIHGAAMAAGLVLARLWTRWREGAAALAPALSLVRGRHLAAAAAAALAVVLVLYSSPGLEHRPDGLLVPTLANLRGPLDSVLAYANYAVRAGGAGLHDHPWHYYLGTLLYTKYAAGPWWSEGLILALAAVGIVAALSGRGVSDAARPFVRFLTFYTIVLTALYSAIPYKTPWCMLAFLHGMILLAGVGVAALVRWMPSVLLKAAVCVIVAALAVQLGGQAWRASYRYYADARNPYVYAHTSTDVSTLVRLVDRLARVSPDGRDMLIKVITPENYWPIPWYLRRFPRVGYWHEVPDDPDAAVVITSPEAQPALDAHLRGRYDKRMLFGLRPTVVMSVYVEEGLWKAFQEALSAPGTAPGGAQRE